MSRNSRTFVTALALILARIADTGTTLHFNYSNSATALLLNSPLRLEGNPMLSVTGNGARTLVLTNLIAVLVLGFLPLWVYWRYPVPRFSTVPANLHEFISLQLFKRSLSKAELFRALCFSLPRNWVQSARLGGFVICWGVVGGSLMAAFNWWVIVGWNWNAYAKFHDQLVLWNYPLLEPLVGVLSAGIAGRVFFRTEFADYKDRNDATGDPVTPNESIQPL
jgi:hypothetical protein